MGIYPLFGLAGLRDERIQVCAVSAMFFFAANQEYKVEFCDRGGLSAIISLARSPSRELRLPACGALRFYYLQLVLSFLFDFDLLLHTADIYP